MKVDFTHDGADGTINFGVDIHDQNEAEAVSKLQPGNGRPDEEGARRIAQLLTGLPTVDYEKLKALVPDEPLPSGFEHYRTFNATTGDPFDMATRLNGNARHLTLHDVLFGVLRSPLIMVNSWTETRKRPNLLPGFLDFDISVVTTEQMVMPCWKP